VWSHRGFADGKVRADFLAGLAARVESERTSNWRPVADSLLMPAAGLATNRPLLAATKLELREYECVYVQKDAEIGLFSDEVVVNCAP